MGPLQANAYLAVCEETRRCALIDPGGDAERLLAAARQEDATVESILLTHAHLDHVGGVAAAARETGAPIYLHPQDLELYNAAPQQARSFGLEIEDPPPPDHEFQDDQTVDVGNAALRVRHAPGHSPGHVCLIGDGFALVGDCVFAGSIGRTDLPGGNYHALMESIKRVVLSLPDETILYSGHGPETTVGRERRANPFLTGAFGWSG